MVSQGSKKTFGCSVKSIIKKMEGILDFLTYQEQNVPKTDWLCKKSDRDYQLLQSSRWDRRKSLHAVPHQSKLFEKVAKSKPLFKKTWIKSHLHNLDKL